MQRPLRRHLPYPVDHRVPHHLRIASQGRLYAASPGRPHHARRPTGAQSPLLSSPFPPPLAPLHNRSSTPDVCPSSRPARGQLQTSVCRAASHLPHLPPPLPPPIPPLLDGSSASDVFPSRRPTEAQLPTSVRQAASRLQPLPQRLPPRDLLTSRPRALSPRLPHSAIGPNGRSRSQICCLEY